MSSLRHGRPLVAIPGPSIMPDRVLAAFRRPMPNIYAGDLIDVSDEIHAVLPSLADTAGQAFVAISNGHGGWQMAIDNVLGPGDKVLVLESGRFAVIWGDNAARSGVEVEVLHTGDWDAVDPAAVQARLAAGPPDEFAAVLCVHVDTATSVRNDVAAIRRAIDAAGSSAWLMVDAIASLGCDEYHMDEWGVDLTVAASQKGLMTPPGLGFVWATDELVEASRAKAHRTAFFDWHARAEAEAIYQRYSGTPPVSHLYALREALRMIDEEGGLPAVWARHRVLADGVRAAVEAWTTPIGLSLAIADPDARSNAVTTIRTGSVWAADIAEVCERDAGLTIGLGVMDRERSFRIGHMGHVNPPSILGAVTTIEAALHTIRAPMGGSGAAAAAAVIGAGMG